MNRRDSNSLRSSKHSLNNRKTSLLHKAPRNNFLRRRIIRNQIMKPCLLLQKHNSRVFQPLPKMLAVQNCSVIKRVAMHGDVITINEMSDGEMMHSMVPNIISQVMDA